MSLAQAFRTWAKDGPTSHLATNQSKQNPTAANAGPAALDCGPYLNSRQIEHEWTRGPGIHLIERSLPERLRQAHCLKRSRARFTFSISRMTIIKTSTSLFRLR